MSEIYKRANGEWVFRAGKEIDDDLYFDTVKECSICKFRMINDSVKYPYCPNCGAYMLKESDIDNVD